MERSTLVRLPSVEPGAPSLGIVTSDDVLGSAGSNRGGITWDGLYNVRDLGGHPTPWGRTRFGAVVRSEGLTLISEAGRSALLEYGIRTIIDLRSPGEAGQEVHPLRHLAGYLQLPLLDDDAVAEVAAIADVAEVYAYMVERRGEQLATILRAMIDSPTPQLVHCKAGKDRTGVVVALLLANAGVGRAFIVNDYALSDRMLRPLYDIWARQAGVTVMPGAEPMRRYPSTPAAMLSLFDRLDRCHGGPRSYLRSIGLTDLELLALGHLLLPADVPMVTIAPD
jgi:protein-tyrosine phosphatase